MKKDYRVLVAEDEPRILRNIIKKIGEANTRFIIESSAQDGVEALTLIEELKPDILFTDIVMPKMDGLKLIEKALQICPTIHIVILSGYNNFSYAKQAIQFGIEDYLLKPLKNADLVEILKSISEKIDLKRKITVQDDYYDLIHRGNDFNSETIIRSENNLVIFLVCLGNYFIQPGVIPREDHQRYEQIWEKIESEILFPAAFGNTSCWSINGKKANQKYFLLELENHNINKVPLYADKIKNIASEYALPFAVTVCYSEKLLSENILYLEARKLRSILRNGLIPSYSMMLNSQENLSPPKKFLHTDEEKKIVLLTEKGERIKLTEIIREILLSWIEARHRQLWIEKGMEHITRAIQTSLIRIEQSKVLDIMQKVYLSFARHSDIESVCDDFLAVIDSELLKLTTSLSPQGLVDMLEMYLVNHYSKRISLEQLSEQFGYEAAYLTRLYKRYKGETPIQALSRVRIENACTLFKKHPELDIKDIGDIVGYSDHHYFSRVFKKLIGMAPSEYRQSL